jgi:hypothetical protein
MLLPRPDRRGMLTTVLANRAGRFELQRPSGPPFRTATRPWIMSLAGQGRALPLVHIRRARRDDQRTCLARLAERSAPNR